MLTLKALIAVLVSDKVLNITAAPECIFCGNESVTAPVADDART